MERPIGAAPLTAAGNGSTTLGSMAAAAIRRQPADGADPRLQERSYDALLVVAFGGPEGMDDIMPFLENVTRGRNIPRERLAAVGRHYELFGGVSPINQQNRDLIAALRTELAAHGIDLPVFLGNRNWDPYLGEALGEMRDRGIRRALAFFTSAFSSYSGCRQYRENIYEAQLAVGKDAPEVLKLRAFYNHPGFIDANADRVAAALAEVPAPRRASTPIVFSAHSIPVAMAEQCRYADQLAESARLVAEAVGATAHSVVYQSRSGSPQVPWLEPDVCDQLRTLHAAGATDVVISPLGFVSDHIEVLYDLDIEARELGREIGLNVVRAGTAGTHPAYVSMIRELIEERLHGTAARRVVGRFAASPDVCATNCCLPGTGRPSPWSRESAASDEGMPSGAEHAREHRG
jgi:protoporphyrin/coproporphyrin ferrochelatase